MAVSHTVQHSMWETLTTGSRSLLGYYHRGGKRVILSAQQDYLLRSLRKDFLEKNHGTTENDDDTAPKDEQIGDRLFSPLANTIEHDGLLVG